MKKFFAMALILTIGVFLSGAKGCGVDVNLQQFVIDTGIEFAGYEIGIDNPNIIDTTIKYCNMLEAGTLEQAVLESGIKYLVGNYGSHPVLGSRMEKIAGYITIDGEIDMDRALELMPAFRSGLILAQEESKKQ